MDLMAEVATTRILLVDDDVELAELVGEYLTREGFTLDAETDGTHALDRAISGDYQLTVLDVMLPGVSGFDLLRGIRAASQMPVLMLTARGDDVDRIVGLELGARIRAVLRRTQTEPRLPGERAPETLGLDDVAMDLGRRTVRRDDAPVELTAVEFTLLELLLRAAGTVVRRDELARGALGRALLPFDRSIDVHVSRLRKKLGPRPGGGERIATLRAVGYMY